MKMKTQNESDTESGTKENEKRKKAGFELAAEPTEVIFFFPTIYYMLGISVLIVIISIICWIGTSKIAGVWDYFVCSVLSTLSIGLIIALPEYFSNIVNFAIHFCYWIAFCLYAFFRSVQIPILRAKWREELEKRAVTRSKADRDDAFAMFDSWFSFWLGCSIIIFLLTLLVVLLMFRMTLFYYRNR